VSPDGRFALSLDFSRLGRLRPGYGYKNIPDTTKDQMAPKEDGVWYLNMKTGKARLILAIADIVQLQPLETMQGAEHYLNHICINPEGNRFLFFHVWLRKGKRYTRLITSNPDGSELCCLINEGHVSHYTWKSNDEILCFSTHADSGMKFYLYQDRSEQRKMFGEGLLRGDGHPSFSPDGKYVLTDTLPDQCADRHLLLFDPENNSLHSLGVFFSPFHFRGELRCDLHPRWSPSGKYIVFDSAHEGKRAIYVLELRRLWTCPN
jgi:Tol biopolymer transport system component